MNSFRLSSGRAEGGRSDRGINVNAVEDEAVCNTS